jgi:ankyrin repeat protein
MIYAAGNGNAECVQQLLAAGVDVNARYAHEATALMWAAAYGKEDTVKLLLAKGADASVRDERGETALSMAEQEKHGGAAALLKAALAAR